MLFNRKLRHGVGTFFPVTVIIIILYGCCPVKKVAVNAIVDLLSSEKASVFTCEDDLRLIEDALPFALKLYESLLQKSPENLPLAVAACRAFTLYAFSFVQTPAEQIDREEIQRAQMLRAKKLYIRGRNHIIEALDRRHPGFGSRIRNGSTDSALGMVNRSDTTALYWAGLSWAAAIMTDRKDLGMLLGLKRAAALIEKVAQYNDGFGEGAVHEFYISYCGSLPSSMGGSEQKAREHFTRAVELSDGKSVAPYVLLASTISVRNGNVDEFRSLLGKALEIDVSERCEKRLMNTVYRNKARWLLDNTDRFFTPRLSPPDTTTDVSPQTDTASEKE